MCVCVCLLVCAVSVETLFGVFEIVGGGWREACLCGIVHGMVWRVAACGTVHQVVVRVCTKEVCVCVCVHIWRVFSP